MTAAPVTGIPADPRPAVPPALPDTALPDTVPGGTMPPGAVLPDTVLPEPRHPGPQLPSPRRTPRLRAPANEPEPLATGAPHPRAYAWSGPPGGPGSTAAPAPAGASGRPDPSGRNAPSPARRDHGIAGRAAEPAWPEHRGADPAATPARPVGPPPHAPARALVRAVLEVLAGRRQPAQLASAVTPEVLRYLAASRPSSVRAVAAGRVHVRQPHRDAAEVVAVCRVGDRIRAVTLRLDARPSGAGPRAPAGQAATAARPGDGSRRWTCTAVRLL